MMIPRLLLILISLLLIWQVIVVWAQLPPYILPSPLAVFKTLWQYSPLLITESKITLLEIFLGLILGIIVGSIIAITMIELYPVRYWLLPIVIMSQAIPTLAIAPLIVMWFGFGMLSKIIVVMLMIFFPITSALYDGLRQTPSSFLDLAKIMNSKKWRTFWYIRLPAALPHFASGLRIAVVVAPIGAIVGEWVGASHGLGFLILSANARMQIDLMFAALILVMTFTSVLYFLTDRFLHKIIFWAQ